MTDQFALTEDQLAIQEMARRFTADNITPFAAKWDEDHHYPVDVWRAAGELGFGAIYVGEEDGGIGLGRLEAALIMEAMAYGCPATSAYISIHNMSAWMIDTYGSPELKAHYLPTLVSMEQMASYCLTEPGSGSDAAALKTTARLDGGDYVLNGGEVAAMAMIEAIGRLVPGVVGNPESLVEESHESGLLEYPAYTKPAVWRDLSVPPVLLSGDHGAIAAWRLEQQHERTQRIRPDLVNES